MVTTCMVVNSYILYAVVASLVVLIPLHALMASHAHVPGHVSETEISIVIEINSCRLQAVTYMH